MTISTEFFDLALPDGYKIRSRNPLTHFLTGPEGSPVAFLDLLLPPLSEHLLEQLALMPTEDNPTFHLGQMETPACRNGAIHFREWDYQNAFDWDTLELENEELKGRITWAREKYVEAILPIQPFACRLRIKQGATGKVSKPDEYLTDLKDSVGDFSFLFSTLGSMHLKLHDAEKMRQVLKNYYRTDGLETSWYLGLYFEKESPPVHLSVPHFFTRHETAVLEAIMCGLKHRLGCAYQWFYRKDENGRYEHTPPEWEDFRYWNEPVNYKEFWNLYDINGRNVYLNAMMPSQMVYEIEGDLSVLVQHKHFAPEVVASGTISCDASAKERVNYYAEHIDKVKFAGFDLDDEMGNYLLCLFTPEDMETYEQVRQCVEQAGFPTFTTDDINRMSKFPAI